MAAAHGEDSTAMQEGQGVQGAHEKCNGGADLG